MYINQLQCGLKNEYNLAINRDASTVVTKWIQLMPTEHTSAEYTLFSLGHGTFSKMDPIPGHETNVQQVQKKKKH